MPHTIPFPSFCNNLVYSKVAPIESPEVGWENHSVWAAESGVLWGSGAVGVRAEEVQLLSS